MQKKDSDSDEELSSSGSVSDAYEVPEKDQNNKAIFNKYAQNSNAIQEEDDEPQQGSFFIKNLDTGEITEIQNIQGEIQFDRKNSIKRKLIKGVSKMNIWEDFWKNVYRNNQELRAHAEKGDLQTVKNLLENGKSGYPVIINSRGLDNWTALHFASYQDHAQMILYLLKNGAFINAVTNFGRTALHISAMRGHLQTVKILCENHIDIERQDEDGNTALHIAAENSQQQIVEYLLQQKISVKPNNYGLTPMDIAPQGQIKQIFQKYGYKQSQKLEELLNEKQNLIVKKNLLDSQLKIQNKIERVKLPTQSLSPNSFNYYRQLGKGSFGQVFLVQKKGEDKLYAMKVLSKQKIFGKNLVKYAMAERNVLSGMNHPFIVKLNYAFQTETKLFLVMDYCPGGDLGKLLSKRKCLTEHQTRLYISQLILAFEALHKNMIVFRDLKPDNVVLDSEGHARLTDFGLSKQGVYNNTTQSFCGSIAYLAPEVLTKQGHSRTVDWYLLGLLIYQLMIGIPPYYNSKKQVLFENIKRGPLKIPKSMSSQAKDLIKKLLCRDPRKRLGAIRDAQQIKQHSFFKGINWNDVLNRKLPVNKIQIPKINLNDTIKVFFSDKTGQKGKRIQDWTFVQK